MPETRYIEEYDGKGNLVNKIPYEISDEQLEREFNDVHTQAILALNNWSSLTAKQKDTILKNLVKWAL